MKCRRLDLGLLSFVLLIGMVAYAPQAKAQSPQAGKRNFKPRVVTSFILDSSESQYPESLAIDPLGNIYVSLTDSWTDPSIPNVGHIVEVTPGGKQDVVATVPTPGGGFLLGVAFDEDGRLYVNAVSDTPGVYRIGHGGSVTCVLALPAGSFPNGLAFHGRDMYVTDSNGAIWKKGPRDTAAPTTPWFQDPLISPGISGGLGANGIAFYRGEMYIGVYDAGPLGDSADSGRIVRLPIKYDGSPGDPVVVVQDSELQLVDGIAFDITGTLWVVMNYPVGIGTVARDGTFTLLSNDPDWLDDPTMVAFGATPMTRTTIFLTNGGGTTLVPNVTAVKADVAGLPLPVE